MRQRYLTGDNMAISKEHAKKSPTQNPTSFFKMEQQGGSQGKPTSVPDKLSGGPMREPLMGRSELSKK